MSKRTFKDFLQLDINRVFVNQGEFAEKAMINGEEMDIILDTDAVNPANTSQQRATYEVLFHVASSYFEYIPQSGMLMDFNSEEYRISSVGDNLGMLTIGLTKNES